MKYTVVYVLNSYFSLGLCSYFTYCVYTSYYKLRNDKLCNYGWLLFFGSLVIKYFFYLMIFFEACTKVTCGFYVIFWRLYRDYTKNLFAGMLLDFFEDHLKISSVRGFSLLKYTYTNSFFVHIVFYSRLKAIFWTWMSSV